MLLVQRIRTILVLYIVVIVLSVLKLFIQSKGQYFHIPCYRIICKHGYHFHYSLKIKFSFFQELCLLQFVLIFSD